MLIVFTLLFKSSSESTAWYCIELIDHAYHALAVTIKKVASTCHFKAYIFKISLREHAPRLPSLTCLAYAVEHHMKEIIISDLNKHHIRSIKSSVHDYDLCCSPWMA